MAPSMLKLGTVALAYTFGVSALSSSPVSSKTYQLSESYNSGNFLEKFSFFEVSVYIYIKPSHDRMMLTSPE